jgi:protein-ribulosamine 3-kinase
MNDFFNSVLLKAFGWKELDLKIEPIGGGCISNTVKLSTKNKSFFLKWKQGSFDMFEKECLGLRLIKKTGSLKVPNTHQVGELEGKGFLLMEFLDSGSTNTKYWEKLGNGLVQLHKNTNSHYGLDHDNYIGSLSQHNKMSKTWSDFFINQRLMPQVKLAYSKGLLDSNILKLFDTLYLQIHYLIPEENPALLHGDLWSGNIHCGPNSEPYLIDTAVYYGHREAELAFTKLFGGFDEAFYDNYDQSFPLISGYKSRTDLFNLYPLLVHLNLFGTSYLSTIMKTLKRYS